MFSDNGPHQEGRHKMEFFDSNGPLRGMKRDLYEGGIRVPFIARWPGRVPAKKSANTSADFRTCSPPCLNWRDQIGPQVDGISIAPTPRQKGQRKHDYLYWKFANGEERLPC